MRSQIKQVLLLVLIPLLSGPVLNAQESSKRHRANMSFNIFKKNLDISSGSWFATIDGANVCLQLADTKNSDAPSFLIHFCIPQTEFSVQEGEERFMLIREAGTLSFKGSFPKIKGVGDFTFKINSSFEAFLKKEGIDKAAERSYDYFKLFLGDITKAYVSGLKKEGYHPTIRELSKLGIHGASLDYIESLSQVGYGGLELGMISKLAIHDVTISYIKDLAAAGYGNLDADMLKKFAVHGISIDYIQSLSSAGYGNLSPDMLKKFAIHNISAAYINSLSEIGYGDLEPNMLKKFAIHNIDADYIKSLKELEIKDPSPDIIKKAMVHNVTAGFIKKARNKGHDFSELSDYIRLKIRG